MIPFPQLSESDAERLLFDRQRPAGQAARTGCSTSCGIRTRWSATCSTGELNLRAMSLVYTTLLSLVPLVAFAFAVLKGFGVPPRARAAACTSSCSRSASARCELTAQIMEFVDNVRGDVLGSVGLAFLLYTVVR